MYTIEIFETLAFEYLKILASRNAKRNAEEYNGILKNAKEFLEPMENYYYHLVVRLGDNEDKANKKRKYYMTAKLAS